jgi:hypothetical protein
MIRNDNELAATRERIDFFVGILAQLRVTCRPDEFPLMAGGYRAEVEQMQREMLDYLTSPASLPTAKAV